MAHAISRVHSNGTELGRWTYVTPSEEDLGEPNPDAPNPVAVAMFEERLQAFAAKESARIGRKNMWLAHHHPHEYDDRCMKWGRRTVCRRCGVLYPVGVLMALLFAANVDLWPRSWDPTAIWVLSIPATVAYCGEAVGLFHYRARWQMAAMLITAVGFGRGLGYEFVSRWSAEFWGPVAFFGGIWFAFTVIGKTGLNRRRKR